MNERVAEIFEELAGEIRDGKYGEDEEDFDWQRLDQERRDRFLELEDGGSWADAQIIAQDVT